MKLSPLMLFVLLLLILVAASFYSSWTNGAEGFAADTNPFSSDSSIYEKYYKNLVKVDGNFWYDSKNGNLYRVTVSGSTKSVTIFDRNGGTKTSYTLTTNDENMPTSVITKKVISPYVGSWYTIDGPTKTQLNYVSWGENTYIYTFDITNATASTSPKYKINKLLYYEGAEQTTKVSLTTNNEIALISQTAYTNSTEVDTNYDDTLVFEPLYSNTQSVYQVFKNIKIDEKNGNFIVNTLIETPPATPPPATPPPVSGFKNIEGFATTPTKAINVYNRQMTASGLIAKPTKVYTEKPIEDPSTTMKDATNPYFVPDAIGNNTILYWPSGKNTLVCIFPNYCSSMTKGIETIKILQLSIIDSDAPPLTDFKKGEEKDDNSDKMMDDYLKWSQYMLKTEVVPPVCPACPSCASGGLCTDCGGKGGCGTKSNDGKSLADTNNISDVKGPSSAVASLGKSAGNAVGGTVDAAGNVIGGTVNAATNLVGGTIGTAADLLKSTGSGLSSLLSGDVRRVGYNQSYQGPGNGYNRNNTGIYQQTNTAPSKIGMVDTVPIDIYSYNGALQSKGTDFRPLTADFGAFSK